MLIRLIVVCPVLVVDMMSTKAHVIMINQLHVCTQEILLNLMLLHVTITTLVVDDLTDTNGWMDGFDEKK